MAQVAMSVSSDTREAIVEGLTQSLAETYGARGSDLLFDKLTPIQTCRGSGRPATP